MFKDNPDLYPTNSQTIARMLMGLGLRDSNVLEPHAGTGNIVRALKAEGAKVTICENDERLIPICSKDADTWLTKDFLTVKAEDISHMDFIIMNPPFSNADKHIKHAWEIAPEGCHVISLSNYEMVSNSYTRNRSSLVQLIHENGNFENLGAVFSDSERTTEVKVALINLWKPRTGENEFEGCFDMEEGPAIDRTTEGLIKPNKLRDIIESYTEAVIRFDKVQEMNNQMNALIAPINHSDACYIFACTSKIKGVYHTVSREDFKKTLKKGAWKAIFDLLAMDKYVTRNLQADINKFVEKQSNVPFTMKNISILVNMVVGTSESRMTKSVVDAFDSVTKHYHENRFSLEGWKTNCEYRVNKKFIIPSIVKVDFRGDLERVYHSHYSHMEDITKALCYLAGKSYTEITPWNTFCQGLKPNTWYEWGFFRIKGYRKGTVHVEFLDEGIWDLFNNVACKAKGFQLAQSYTQEYRKKQSGVALVQK